MKNNLRKHDYPAQQILRLCFDLISAGTEQSAKARMHLGQGRRVVDMFYNPGMATAIVDWLKDEQTPYIFPKRFLIPSQRNQGTVL